MPDKAVGNQAGNITRLKQLLKYFNETPELEVDFVSLKDWGGWQKEDIVTFNKEYPNIGLKLISKKHKNNYWKYLTQYKIPYLFKRNSVDITSLALRKEFGTIMLAKKYDTILISYAAWGNIIGRNPHNSYAILDTHDFITAQNKDSKNIGRSFQDEIKILNKFDEVWSYSVEEEYIFDQFTRPETKITLIPISFPNRTDAAQSEKTIDVIYVASNNPHNIAGIEWTKNKVFPHLPNVKIHVFGNICDSVSDCKNIKTYGRVECLDEVYRKAKLAICPMMSGTGIKIKVLESLSYGLPVVTTRRGIDGLMNKRNNGCVVANDSLDFANTVLRLLQDEDYYREVQKEGIKYFTEHHDLAKEIKLLNRTFKHEE